MINILKTTKFSLLTQQQRTLVVLVALAFAGVSALISYQLVTSYQAEIRQSTINTTNLSFAIDQYVTQTIKSSDFGLIKVKENVEEQIKNGKRIEELNLDSYLAHQRELISNISGFRVANSKGQIIFPSGLAPESKVISDREYFIKQREHPDLGLFISKPVIGRINKVLSIIISRRLNDRNGKFIGTVHAVFQIQEFTKYFETMNLGKDAVISLWSNDRFLLTRFPYSSNSIGTYIPAPPPLNKIINSGAGLSNYEGKSAIDDIQRIWSFRKSHNYPFQILVGLSKNEVLMNWKIGLVFTFFGFLFIITLSIVSLLLYFQSQRALDAEKAINIQNSKMSALGEMAAGIAHEINNPLTIISTRAAQLQRLVDPVAPNADRLVSGLKNIEQTSYRIGKIIQGLRTLSRNSSNDPAIAVDVHTIVQDTLELCRSKFQEAGIDLVVDCPEHIYIECKATQISQVILNLLNNSIDAVDNLQEKWVRLNVEVYSDKIIIVMTDSGRGIKPEIVEKLMTPFFTTKPIGRGTGLGLSISRRIVEDHKGKFYYEPNCRNTCFKIEFPKLDISDKKEKAA